jgi:hypothetical protein
VPGPGSYFPEQVAEKPHSSKPKPFGSTTRRFGPLEHTNETIPAVGSYEVEKSYSIFNKVKANAINYYGQPFAPFGTIANRFLPQKPTNLPGPGAYDADIPKQTERKTAGIFQLGSTKLLLGDTQLPSEKVHIPAFGTQSNRFKDYLSDLPPPGYYDISESFESMKTKGKAQHISVLASKCKRDVFRIKESTPAPGQYTIFNSGLKKEIRRKTGAFSSTVLYYNLE